MGVTQVRKGHLWTPTGDIPVAEKDVIKILNPRDVQMLAWLHEWAFNQQINIFCKKCEQPIRGQNNDGQTKRLSVACACREWVWAG